MAVKTLVIWTLAILGRTGGIVLMFSGGTGAGGEEGELSEALSLIS